MLTPSYYIRKSLTINRIFFVRQRNLKAHFASLNKYNISLSFQMPSYIGPNFQTHIHVFPFIATRPTLIVSKYFVRESGSSPSMQVLIPLQLGELIILFKPCTWMLSFGNVWGWGLQLIQMSAVRWCSFTCSTRMEK